MTLQKPDLRILTVWRIRLLVTAVAPYCLFFHQPYLGLVAVQRVLDRGIPLFLHRILPDQIPQTILFDQPDLPGGPLRGDLYPHQGNAACQHPICIGIVYAAPAVVWTLLAGRLRGRQHPSPSRAAAARWDSLTGSAHP